MKFNYILTFLASNAFFALAKNEMTRVTTVTSGKLEGVATISSDVIGVKLDCYGVIPSEIEKHKNMNTICEEDSCYEKVKSSETTSYSMVKYQTGKKCDFYTKKADSARVTTITSGKIEVVATLSPDVADVKLDCYNVIPSEIEEHKNKKEICDDIDSTCFEKVKSSDAASYSTIKYLTGKKCDIFTKKTASAYVPTSTKIVPQVTTVTSGKLAGVATISPDVVDVKLDCYNVIPSEIEKHKNMNTICEDGSCFEKVKSSDASSYSMVKYQTGKKCDFYTKKADAARVTTISSGKIEVVATLSPDVADVKLDCYNSIPSEIEEHKNKDEICDDSDSTCFKKVKSSDASSFSTVKYLTGKRCDIYTKKAGPTNYNTVVEKRSKDTKKACAAKYAQCGGVGFNGPTCCQEGYKCKQINKYYSHCH